MTDRMTFWNEGWRNPNPPQKGHFHPLFSLDVGMMDLMATVPWSLHSLRNKLLGPQHEL